MVYGKMKIALPAERRAEIDSELAKTGEKMYCSGKL